MRSSKRTWAQIASELWPKPPAVDAEPWTPEAIFRKGGLIPDPWQAEVFSRVGDQLLLCHRQAGKSTTAASIALADCCTAENTLVLLVSRSMRQSGELFRKVKDFYRATQPLPLIQESALSLELSNHSRIISLPGSEETIVGYSKVRRVILDEAARIPDAVYYAIRPMLAMSGGDLLAMSTPFGRRGWFWEAWEGKETDDSRLDAATVQALLDDLGIVVRPEDMAQDNRQYGWRKTSLTAVENGRLSRRFLASERRSIPALWFDQEWLCKFVELGQVVFRYEDIQAMLRDDVEPLWDTGGQMVLKDVPMLDVGTPVWSGAQHRPIEVLV